MKSALSGILLFFFAVTAIAVTPQFWDKNTQQDFAAGDPQSISITSRGELLLSPGLKRVYQGIDSIIWKIVRDSAGNLYAATGNDGKVIKLTADGKSSTVLDTNELEVQSILLDRDDNLYAATSPDGKVYRIKKDGTSGVFFDPPDKYIWCLTWDESGNLIAGTGDEGRIYRIDAQGKGTVWADTAESNITALAWHPRNRMLLAGSAGNGMLYQVESTGKTSVLFDSGQEQITAIYVENEGAIYFSTITGMRPAPETRTPQMPQPQPAPAPENSQPEGGEVTTTVEVSATPVFTPVPAMPAGASYLYKLNPTGNPEIVYASPEDQILGIAAHPEDRRLVLSTGKKARLIVVDSDKKSTVLLKSTEEQITSLVSGKKLWIATSNPGNIYELSDQHASEGSFVSEVRDTSTRSIWGKLIWKGDVPQGTSVSFSFHSGNTGVPDDTWSAWQSAAGTGNELQISSPKARFVQWKADLKTSNAAISPVVRSVSLAYVQQNLAPEIGAIVLHPPGIVFKRAPIYPQDSFAGMAEPLESEQAAEETPLSPAFDVTMAGKREFRKGFQTITWTASDANQDKIAYDLHYRPVSETNWRTLSVNLKETVFAWDTQTIPDDTYLIQVTAHDGSSNPKEMALSAMKSSESFVVDNTAPVIEVKISAGVLEVAVRDDSSPIQKLEYSVIPGTWEQVFPVDAVNDSKAESYRIDFSGKAGTSPYVVLKASDRLSNVSVIRFRL